MMLFSYCYFSSDNKMLAFNAIILRSLHPILLSLDPQCCMLVAVRLGQFSSCATCLLAFIIIKECNFNGILDQFSSRSCNQILS